MQAVLNGGPVECQTARTCCWLATQRAKNRGDAVRRETAARAPLPAGFRGAHARVLPLGDAVDGVRPLRPGCGGRRGPEGAVDEVGARRTPAAVTRCRASAGL